MSRPSLIVVLAVCCSVPACRQRPAATAETRPAETAAIARPGEWIEIKPPPQGAEAATTAASPTPAGHAAPAAADPDLALAPLADAEVGEWARYRTAQGWIQQYRVTAIERRGAPGSGTGERPDEVVIEVRVVADGQLVGLRAERREPASLDWPLAEARRRKAGVAQRLERIYAAGRSWDCRLTQARWGSGQEAYEQRTWVSPDAPVYGIVRMEVVRLGGSDPVSCLELLEPGPP